MRYDGIADVVAMLAESQTTGASAWSGSLEECRKLYIRNGLARRVVDEVANDMVRAGWKYKVSKEFDKPEIREKVVAYERRIMFRQALRRAIMYARRDGGGLVLLEIDDGKDSDQPVDIGAIKSIRQAIPVTADGVHVAKLTDASWYEAEIWRVGSALDVRGTHIAAGGKLWHHTRTLPIRGNDHGIHLDKFMARDAPVTSPNTAYPVDLPWIKSTTVLGESVLASSGDAIVAFTDAMLGASETVASSNVAKMGVDNFVEWTRDAETRQQLINRMWLQNHARKRFKFVPYDKQHEEFEFASTTFSGLHDAILDIMHWICSCTGYTTVKLFGVSPGGFGTGKAEDDNWSDNLHGQQVDLLWYPMQRIGTYIHAAKDGPTGGRLPDMLEPQFMTLRQPNESERSTTFQTVANAVVALKDASVITIDEARSAFGPDGMTPQIAIDREADLRKMKAEREALGVSEEPNEGLAGGDEKGGDDAMREDADIDEDPIA